MDNKPGNKYKIGDKVVIINKLYPTNNNQGIITKTFSLFQHQSYLVALEHGGGGWWDEDLDLAYIKEFNDEWNNLIKE